MVAATSLWGVSSALMSAISAPSLGAAAPVAAGGALVILAVCVLRGDHPWRTLAADRWLYLGLGILEMTNLMLYVAALRLGPLPVVVALHLTAPMLIIVAEVLTGRRGFNISTVIELVLVSTAILLVTAEQSDLGDAAAIGAGCALAVASAACVAGLVTLVARHAAGRPTMASAGLQLLIAAGFCLPMMVSKPPSYSATIHLIAVGAFALGPGFALYWWALKTLDATTAGIIGLNEAVAASVVGALLTSTRITPTTLLAGGLVLTAVAVQLRSGSTPDARQLRKPRTRVRPCLHWGSRPHC
ncbi:DMT family transporter [Nocardia arizonensis]|uniref:DMT family transporter n=1 Tax=Nocardia arizonensis TaxID=1141647 RepID=UPI0012E27760|nr:DMT family transporter [Nocardia arizonensis]